MEVLLGLLLGVVGTLWGMTYFNKKRGVQQIEKQSVVLLEKIKSVCKLITVEGDFAEIYHYEDTKSHLFNVLSSRKKAILLINATAHVGVDLSKVKLAANSQKREVILTQFPAPSVLSVETSVKYYDKKDGLFNKFDAADLTVLHEEAKNFIIEKIPESGLMLTAQKEALDTIKIIAHLLEMSGWTLNYSQMRLSENETKKLK
jgi:hypothetical protein